MYNEAVLSFMLAAALVSPASAAFSVEKDTAPLTTLAAVSARLEAIESGLKGLSADFKQSVLFSASETAQEIEGSLQYSKPDRLRVEHHKPERQTIVSDGKSIWVHRKSQNQVIEASLKEWKASDPLLASLLDFGSYSSWLKKYDVSFSSAPLELLLLPKTGPSEFNLRLRLNRWGFPVETELAVSQMKVRTVLENLKINPDIRDSAFAFAPPAGADVFRNFKPPRLNP